MDVYANALKTYFKPMRTASYSKGEIILHAGEPVDTLMLVQSGFVKAYTITAAGESSLVAIKSMLDIIPVELLFAGIRTTPYFYEAVTDTAVRVTSKTDFEAAVRSDIALANAVLQNTLHALRAYEGRVQNFEAKSARQRVLFRLLYLVDQFGLHAVDDRHIISIPVTYQDLADAINVTRETANREVSQLIREGLVEKRRGFIIIKHRDKLEAELES